jgi:hypothetical protein
MRITNKEKKELNQILLECGFDSSHFDINHNDRQWRINTKPDDFSFVITRRESDYVIHQIYPDKIKKPQVTKSNFPDIKNLFKNWTNTVWSEIIADPEYVPGKKELFSDYIKNISPRFPIIFNQSVTAELLGLDEICGIGYRKALEFLIKDYLIYKIQDSEHYFIKNNTIMKCINKYSDKLEWGIKITSERGFWLGNDHAHYVIKWEDKTLKDLKDLINQTVKWIDMHEKTNELTLKMPNKKKIN